MNRFLCTFVCFVFLLSNFLGAEDDNQSNRAKIIYVKISSTGEDTNHSVYVGETIRIVYSLLLFSNARFVGTEFVGGIDSAKLVLKNPNTKWNLSSDGSYQAIYEYKIKAINASIPPLKVMAVSSDGDYTDFSIAPAISLNVIDLHQNQKYVGVVADSFNILGYKAKTYDNLNNILVFEVEAKNSNLEDLKIPEDFKQGFESTHFGGENSDGIYYCILPKNVQNISFEYFSLKENRFKDITIPIKAVDDTVSTQDDIRPKNNFLVFSNIILIILIVLSLIFYFIFHKKKIFLVVFGVLIIYLSWKIFFSSSGVLLADKPIRILPTYNSTILEMSKTNVEVEIIGQHQNYYKIVTPDERVGWVEKNDIK
ncbi:SH3 domain-containing protein [Helicobacter sp. 13S00477-4]|uniref:SH3 domain-containing protein n=1 Tax=Helicobacter sp. 13S00477-4 TaxID=1905759 RepID=UPI000BA7C594|nr:SH3 domain-containing protein [Helicobacter sp. 13S00477-4]PAF50592.1 hypothetical protein BKH44_07445 [Helicobacter sp. 13S00477-4]